MDRVTRRRLGLATHDIGPDAVVTVCADRLKGGELFGALARLPCRVRWWLSPNADVSPALLAWLDELGHAVRFSPLPSADPDVWVVSRRGEEVSASVGGRGALSRPWERMAEPSLSPVDGLPAWLTELDAGWARASGGVHRDARARSGPERREVASLAGRPSLEEVLQPDLDWAGFLDALERADAAWRRRFGVAHRWLWDPDQGWLARLDDLSIRVDAPLARLGPTAMDTLVGVVGPGEPGFFGGLEASTRARFRAAERHRALTAAWDAGLSDARALSATPQIGALDALVRAMLGHEGLWYTSVSRGLMAIRPDLFPVVHARVREAYRRQGFCFLRRADTYTPGLPYRRLLERLHATAWFRSPAPRGRRQRAVWDRRAALLAVFAFQPMVDDRGDP